MARPRIAAQREAECPVVGEAETVDVAAGSFDALKATMSPLDGEGGEGTMWISREAPRTIVRSESKLPPQMGGGTATSELTAKTVVE